MTTTAPDTVVELVRRFQEHKAEYVGGRYNETQLRREFVDPLFEALEWDVNNTKGRPGSAREVVHEDSLVIGRGRQAPDYAFNSSGVREFFVETKKPSVNIAHGIAPAYQLRRYGWSANLAVSVLTDFEEFAVYDCRIPPNIGDAADTARILYLTYEEYIDRWCELYNLFSKSAVQDGSLFKFARDTKKRGNERTVDAQFLEEIEKWRKSLASNIFRHNPHLDADELNLAVQRTIDRIVFLRIAEDRGFERQGTLDVTSRKTDIYGNLMQLFKKADERYNSGLFHFSHDAGPVESIDRLTPKLQVDDEPLSEIIQDLYYPRSPYEFSVIPPEILGQVYEQFLGQVITIEESEVNVEPKPEVRKAGGVYYTPSHVVNYIVRVTLGPFLEGKTPNQISGKDRRVKNPKPIRLLDPACGSGSFLMGAYQYLLDWYRERYVKNDPERLASGRNPVLYEGPGGEWRLTIAERRRILLTHIVGVDLDPQATEVAKLSLLLKVLEGESGDVVAAQMDMFNMRALPDLASNVKCGNALIDSDFFSVYRTAVAGEEERRRINAFDWDFEFSETFQGGGFDVVVGNPPYIDSEWMTRYWPNERAYYAEKYDSASGNWDIFCVFIERALQLATQGGAVSMIVPNKLASAEYARSVRSILAEKNQLTCIRDYSRVKVFPVAVYPVVFVARRWPPQRDGYVVVERMGAESGELPKVAEKVELEWRKTFSDCEKPWPIFELGRGAELLTRLETGTVRLEEVAEVWGGATVKEAYWLKDLIEDDSDPEVGDLKIINSGTIDPYFPLWGYKALRYLGLSIKSPVIKQKNQPLYASERIKQARSGKVVVAGMTKRLEAVLDWSGEFLAAKSTTIITGTQYPAVIAAVLNSKAMQVYYSEVYGGDRLQGGYLRVGPPQLKRVPIPAGVTEEVAARLEELVKEMQAANGATLWASTEHKYALAKRESVRLAEKIEAEVCELYGIEKAAVEAALE